ncbi:hypothetical protein B5X24_HaOG212154 [Helicoverpa armigera]|nr:hypothetical protein B5X24_HaOG212154 [Helicoverpa armigera]
MREQGAERGGARQQAQTAPAESQILALVRQEMAAFQARFSVLEGRVLRPPLAASKPPAAQRASYAAAVAAAPPPRRGPPSKPPVAAPNGPTRRAPAQPKPKTARAVQAQRPPVPPSAPAPSSAPVAKCPPKPTPSAAPTSSATESEWQVVGEKKKRRRAAKAAKKKAQKRRRRERAAAAQLRAPKTAAVVVTLLPDAVKRGVSYRDVLAQAKEAVNLQELGIASGLRLRVTATGARMLEVPGAASGPAADALAERLRASISADDARVSRPHKCADLRIMGLDDSATAEEVVAAVARTGGCSADEVKAGTIRPDFRGTCTITVSCPVTAAKNIVDGRRLLVGWVSAQVKLLDPRPLRCFRCHVGHHVGVRCPSEVDRSALCFRCGQPGHKAVECSATPHCSAYPRLRWPGVISRHPAPMVSTWSSAAAGMRGANSLAFRLLLLEHDRFAEGGDGIPFPLAPDHGLNQGRMREVAAAHSLDEDPAVPLPCGAHLDCVVHRVLGAVRTMVTPGHLLTTDAVQVPPETTVSSEDLRHAVREGAVTLPEPLLKEGTYRHDGGVPCTGLQQSLPPGHHEIAPELRPLRDNLPRQRGLLAPVVQAQEDPRLQIPR